MSILNGLDVIKIINSNPFEQNLIAIISNLEAVLQKVSNDALEDFECNSIDELTLRQLGRIYKSSLYKDNGLYGVCWEHGIYKFILYEDDYIHSICNDAINKLTGETRYEIVDVILWGGERKNLDVESILLSLNDNAKLWSEGQLHDFKKIIRDIYLSFNKKNKRKELHDNLKGAWKTDMFIKKRGSDIWFAVTVKWNKSDCKHYPGLSIGICFENVGTYGKVHEVEIQKNPLGKNQFAIFCVPFIEFNFSKYIVDRLNFFKKVLDCINSKNKNVNIAYFGNPADYELFLELYKIRENTCVSIIEYLKDKLNVKSVTEKRDSILLSTDDKIMEPINQSQKTQIVMFDTELTSRECVNTIIMPDIIK